MVKATRDNSTGCFWFWLWLAAFVLAGFLGVFRQFVNWTAGPFNDRTILATLDAVLIALAFPLITFVVAGFIALPFFSPVMLLHTTVGLTGVALVSRLAAIVLYLGEFMAVSSNWSREVAARLGTEAVLWLYFAIEMGLILFWAKRLQARDPSDKMTQTRLLVLLVTSLFYGQFIFYVSRASLFIVLHGSI